MPATVRTLSELGQQRSWWLSRFANGFKPPYLPPVSERAFRFHMAFTLFYAFFEGVIANAPLMAVKSLDATDVQLQLPLAMASFGMFGAVLLGAVMARRRKKPFVVVPGFAGAAATLAMSFLHQAGPFLFLAGMVSICDFAMRPAIPSIVRIVYPDHCRSQVAGVIRQYASIVFLVTSLTSAALLSGASGFTIRRTIALEITVAAIACAAASASFMQLPDRGDGSAAEAAPAEEPQADRRATFIPFQNKWFRRYLAAFFVFGFANLFHQGVIPAFFARDMGLGYMQATLLMHVIPNVSAFLTGGYLTRWFERTSVWRSYALVTFLWGMDPFILATASVAWPAVVVARIARGPAILGSMVIAFYTGVHSFARPGGQTSRYMAAQYLVTGLARLTAPTAAAIMLAFLSRRSMILCGSLGILASSLMFWWYDRRSPVGPESRRDEPAEG